MSNINDSFNNISATMKNYSISYKLTKEVTESIAKITEQIRSIKKIHVPTIFIQNQNVVSQIKKQLITPSTLIQDFGRLPQISSVCKQFVEENGVLYNGIHKVYQQYDYTKLTKIMQRTLETYDYNNQFDINIITEQVAEAYISDEENELSEKSRNIDVSDKKEHIRNVRDWISFYIAIIGLFLSIYSVVSTKKSNTYNTTIEVINYYVNDLEISAEMLNAMSYRIVVKNNVMPRIKPDCSSCVMGYLNIGQVVMVSDKYKKWVKIDWEDEDGDLCSGWVQNYKLTKFK